MTRREIIRDGLAVTSLFLITWGCALAAAVMFGG